MGPDSEPRPIPPARAPFLRNAVLAEALTEQSERVRLGLPESEDEPLYVIVELNLRHRGGLRECARHFNELYPRVFAGRPPADRPPVAIDNTYRRCLLSVADARELALAEADLDPMSRTIYRIWPDFPITPQVDRSVATIKADAASRSYNANGVGITWAVIDSGIAGDHPHFERYGTMTGVVQHLHRDFTVDPEREADLDPGRHAELALTDDFGHGTHVAGIIAGGLPPQLPDDVDLLVAQKEGRSDGSSLETLRAREFDRLAPDRFGGVAPLCKLVSLKVMDGNGRGLTSNITRALRYIREEVNGTEKLLQIHGVNLSVGYEFDAKWFACGQSPLCVEVNKLVRTGVVVVVAAGNTGYGRLTAAERQTNAGLTLTINDPGNAELAITVGSTHRDMPHTYGVSYFSSKGPTGDGRPKPDLVAPGERITSCAAGQNLKDEFFSAAANGKRLAGYLDDSGTSMAAPHVSGAVAAFLSIRREFIGQPERVKQIFLSSATSLGRTESFQGSGMVDLMRSIQSI